MFVKQFSLNSRSGALGLKSYYHMIDYEGFISLVQKRQSDVKSDDGSYESRIFLFLMSGPHLSPFYGILLAESFLLLYHIHIILSVSNSMVTGNDHVFQPTSFRCP